MARSTKGKSRRPAGTTSEARPASARQVRIIAGEFRGRRLTFPDLPGLRPTADRVRETLFNWLQADVVAEHCLDLFAGSGACGFECLSRGASTVTFVDRSSEVCRYLQTGLRQLLEGQSDHQPSAQIHNVSAQDFLQRNADQSSPYGLVFLDPPFADDCLLEISQQLETGGLLKEKALIYVESGSSIPLVSQLAPLSNWQVLKEKKAGAVRFALFQRLATGTSDSA